MTNDILCKKKSSKVLRRNNFKINSTELNAFFVKLESCAYKRMQYDIYLSIQQEMCLLKVNQEN